MFGLKLHNENKPFEEAVQRRFDKERQEIRVWLTKFTSDLHDLEENKTPTNDRPVN